MQLPYQTLLSLFFVCAIYNISIIWQQWSILWPLLLASSTQPVQPGQKQTPASCCCLCSTWDHVQCGQGLLFNPSLLLVLSLHRFSAWWSMQLTSQGVFYENCSLWKTLSGISRRKHLKQSKSSVCVLLFGRFQKGNWLGKKKKTKIRQGFFSIVRVLLF